MNKRNVVGRATALLGTAAVTVPLAVASNAPAAEAVSLVPCNRNNARLVDSAPIKENNGTVLGTVYYYQSSVDDCVWASVATSMGAACQNDTTGCAWVYLDIGGATAAKSWTAVGGTKAVTVGYRHTAAARGSAFAGSLDAVLGFGATPYH